MGRLEVQTLFHFLRVAAADGVPRVHGTLVRVQLHALLLLGFGFHVVDIKHGLLIVMDFLLHCVWDRLSRLGLFFLLRKPYAKTALPGVR